MKKRNKSNVYGYVLMFLLGFLVAFLLINPSKEINQNINNDIKEKPSGPSLGNKILDNEQEKVKRYLNEIIEYKKSLK